MIIAKDFTIAEDLTIAKDFTIAQDFTTAKDFTLVKDLTIAKDFILNFQEIEYLKVSIILRSPPSQACNYLRIRRTSYAQTRDVLS